MRKYKYEIVSPELEQAAYDLMAEEITKEDYNRIVAKSGATVVCDSYEELVAFHDFVMSYGRQGKGYIN